MLLFNMFTEKSPASKGSVGGRGSITSLNYDKNVNNNTKLLSKLDKICYYNSVNEITNKLIPLCLTVKNFSHPLCCLDDAKKTRRMPSLFLYLICSVQEIYRQNVPYFTGTFSTFCFNCNFFISLSTSFGVIL
jgi:hypothetical protein